MTDQRDPKSGSIDSDKSDTRNWPLISSLAVGVLVFVGCCGLGPLIVQIPFHLFAGWAFFLFRTLPGVTINPAQCLFGVLLVIGVFGSLYWFGRSVTADRSRKWNAKHAGLIVWLVLASFVIGLGATGVAHQIGWLFRSPEPLIGGSMRAVRRMSDSNNHKQVLLGVHNYASVSDKVINTTIVGDEGQLLHGWQTALLPYVEHQDLYEQVDRDRSWNHPVNSAAMRTRVPVYETPSPGLPTMSGSYALTHQAANALIFSDPKIRTFRDIKDGLSNTIYSGGAAGNYAAWAHPANWRDPSLGINRSPDGFGGPFHGGCHVAMADGAVIFITDSIDPQLLRALSTPDGGEEIEEQLNQ